MALLLDLAYLLVLVASVPRLVYRRLKTGEHVHLGARLGRHLAPTEGAPIWLHGASVGEVSLLVPLVAALERSMPGTPLVISAYSPTGFAAAARLFPQHRVIVFPLDFSFVVERAIRTLDPQLIVIVESDLWPNFLRRAAAHRVPVAIVNAKVSERSFRLHARLRLLARPLAGVALVAAEDEQHAERFVRLGVPRERVEVTGNMKYDLTQPPAETGALRYAGRRRLGYDENDVLVLGGSLHAGEERVLLRAFRGLPGAALTLVPRYPSDASEMAEQARALGYSVVLKSEIDHGRVSPRGARAVLVVDTLGELRELYAAADIALVGGSLFYRGANKGGHNLMEPAVLGVPVLFGPYNVSFAATAERLVAEGGGMLVRDAEELAAALTVLATDADARARMGEHARSVVLASQGATARNSALIRSLLDTALRSLPAVPPPTHNAASER